MQMRNKDFHRQNIGDQDSDDTIELTQPELEGTKMELANIQRWEDVGGQVIDCVDSRDHSNSYPTQDGERLSAPSPLKDIGRPLSPDGTEPSTGSNKSPRKR